MYNNAFFRVIVALALYVAVVAHESFADSSNTAAAATQPPQTQAPATTAAVVTTAPVQTSLAQSTPSGTATKASATVSGSTTVSISFSPTPSLNPDTDCVQLSTSNACGAMTNFKVSRFLFNLTGSDTDAVAQFDSYIDSWTGSTRIGELARSFQCSKYNNFNASSIRYLRSYNCISAMAMSNWCNSGKTIAKPICNTMCWNMQDSLQALFNDTSPYCSSGAVEMNTRGYVFTSMRTICSSVTWREDDANCLSGMSADAQSCGYSDSSMKAAHCSSNPSDPCCSSSGSSSGGNKQTVVIAVVASILGVLFIAAFAGVIMFSRKRNTKKAADAEDAKASDETVAAKSSRNNIEPFKKVKAFRVNTSYIPQLHDELSLSVGDHVIATGQLNSEWLYGQNLRTGETGVFPYSNLRKYNIAKARESFVNVTKNAKLRVVSAFVAAGARGQANAQSPAVEFASEEKGLPVLLDSQDSASNKEVNNDTLKSLAQSRESLSRISQQFDPASKENGQIGGNSPQLTPKMTPLMTPILPSMHSRRRSTASLSLSNNVVSSPNMQNSPMSNSVSLPGTASLNRRSVLMRPVTMMMMPNGYLLPLSMVERDENGEPIMDGEIVNLMQHVESSSDETLGESTGSQDGLTDHGDQEEEEESNKSSPPLLN